MARPLKSGRPPGAEAASTRARLLKHAREVFSAAGYRDATPAQIAERAEVTRAMIYRYFGSKAALYEAVFTALRTEVIGALVGDEDGGGPGRARGALDRISTVFRRGAQLNREDPTYARFTMSALVDTARIPELTPLATAQVEEFQAYFERLVEEGVAAGTLSPELDRRSVANVLVASLWGIGVLAAFQWDADEMEAATDMLARLLETGLPGLGQNDR